MDSYGDFGSESLTGVLADFRSAAGSVTGTQLNMKVIEWNKGKAGEELDFKSFEGFLGDPGWSSRPEPNIRVVFAPADRPHAETVHGLIRLFRHFQIPDGFLNEGLRDVSLSFGSQWSYPNADYIWFHLACKDVSVKEVQDGWEIFHDGNHNRNAPGQPIFRERRQANFNWIRPGFVLIKSKSKPENVTLLCFGAPSQLWERFLQKKSFNYDAVLDDPFVLLEVVMEQIGWFVDERAWMVAEAFGHIEEGTIEDAKNAWVAGNHVNYPGLHSIAKHIIFLKEASNVVLDCLERVQALHTESIGKDPSGPQRDTQRAFAYRKSIFQSTQHRLTSVDRRMTNILALSFNLVAQRDSRTMQKEGKSMKTIAVVTLVFLPLTTVATVFGSQMFTLDPNEPHHLRTSADFWLIWAISIPLTLVVLIGWRLWYRDARAKITHDRKPWWRKHWGESARQAWRRGESRILCTDKNV